ncbi:MAG: sigma 54-interacting transcriptional regulator [Acidobacteriota bacterium]
MPTPKGNPPVADAGERWRRDLETETRAGFEGAEMLSTILVPGWTILWHPDADRIGERAALPELLDGEPAPLSRSEPLFSQPGDGLRRPLADPYLSRKPCYLRRRGVGGDGTYCIERGEFPADVDVDGVPLSALASMPAEALDGGVVVLLANRVLLLLHLLDPAPSPGGEDHGLVGESLGIRILRREIAQLAPLDLPVLITGETGTGKERVAEALHVASGRGASGRGASGRGTGGGGPFVPVNMASLPPSLAAAELFGAERGAFTGAQRKRRGFFARADGGTLLLDEVGDTPPEVQAALLRVLETGRVQPLGGGADRRVDVRVLAATDLDLERAIEDGRFRAPLLHRLSGYRIRVPPLRRRRDDIGRLLATFLAEDFRSAGEPADLAKVPVTLVAQMARRSWPGNVRQLRNVSRQLVIALGSGGPHLPEALVALLDAGVEGPARGDGQRVGPHTASPGVNGAEHEGPESGGGEPPEAGSDPPRRSRYRHGLEVSERELTAALRANRWRLQPTAKQLGISRTVLYRLVAASDRVRKAGDLGEEEIAGALDRHGGDLEALVEDLEVSRDGLVRRMGELGLRRR